MENQREAAATSIVGSISEASPPVVPSRTLAVPNSNSSNNSINSINNDNEMAANTGNANSTPPNHKTSYSIPKNPKDTAAYVSPGGMGGASPKRRMKGVPNNSADFGIINDPFSGNNANPSNHSYGGGGVSRAGNSVGTGSIGNTSNLGGATVKSAKSAPAHRDAGRAPIPTASPQLRTPNGMTLTPGSVPGSVASLHSMKDVNYNGSGVPSGAVAAGITVDTRASGRNDSNNLQSNPQNNHRNHSQRDSQGTPSRPKHSLDDEEQFMFEQRLTRDELGVAIRKISHSGKAQLRYVKCVALRPPSSSDFDERTGLNMPYGDPHSSRGRPPSDAISVSSISSTGSRFMERMRNSTANMSRRLISGSTSGGSAAPEGRALSVGDSDNLLLTSVDSEKNDKSLRALTWGKKNAVVLSLDKFSCVRKGKTTERTLKNNSPSSRLLSIITNVRGNESLDIEAPTMLDRDKFASAFARFLGVPLMEEESGGRASAGAGGKKKIRAPSLTRSKKKNHSAAQSEPGLPVEALSPSATITPKMRNRASTAASDSLLPALTPTSDKASDADRELAFHDESTPGQAQKVGNTSRQATTNEFANVTPAAASALGMGGGSRHNSSSQLDGMDSHSKQSLSESARKRISLDGGQGESMLEPRGNLSAALESARMPDHSGEAGSSLDIHARKDDPIANHNDTDNHSHVSSLTGGVDQEIVEELHQAIIELRSELDASRAEAARAVKVAEQAIQSAENCTSSDWNSTVTHKAAEAAAQAQKKSAEAIARARMAEERLAAERKSTSFWRKQAQAAEEEAGSLKTRSAAAEVKQAVMMEELAGERRKAARMFASLKQEFVQAEKKQGEEMSMIQEQKRSLEAELEEAHKEMDRKDLEARRTLEAEMERKERPKGPNRMKPNFRRPRSSSQPREKKSGKSSPVPGQHETSLPENEATRERIVALQNEADTLRKQFELVKHTSMDEILSLHRQSEEWSNQAQRAVAASTAEMDHLREKLAAESAMRLKLLNELQDIRGTVRVYCRSKPCIPGKSSPKSILKIPTHDILLLNEDTSPMSFKFDRVFSPGSSQYEVFSELEEPLISSLDGFNVTLVAFGQGGSGKTHTLLGDVIMDVDDNEEGNESSLPSLRSHGVQLQAIQQLFTIASHRTDRYKDVFSMTMVEVHNEKLFDLVAGTPSAERDGEVVICETRDRRRESSASESAAGWRKGKLEIRTNIDGNTVVQGLVSIPIRSFEDAIEIWRESIAQRAERLRAQGTDATKHERKTNVITTIHITSVNIATGVGTEGKLQFVDMASSDIVRGSKKAGEDHNIDVSSAMGDNDTQFSNKSIVAFNDVINARCQFDRSVPYRNSTLTHLLRDSLEADTKVLLMCCVSSEQAHLEDTLGVLRFASRMQKVSIGKATKHIIGSKE